MLMEEIADDLLATTRKYSMHMAALDREDHDDQTSAYKLGLFHEN